MARGFNPAQMETWRAQNLAQSCWCLLTAQAPVWIWGHAVWWLRGWYPHLYHLNHEPCGHVSGLPASPPYKSCYLCICIISASAFELQPGQAQPSPSPSSSLQPLSPPSSLSTSILESLPYLSSFLWIPTFKCNFQALSPSQHVSEMAMRKE